MGSTLILDHGSFTHSANTFQAPTSIPGKKSTVENENDGDPQSVLSGLEAVTGNRMTNACVQCWPLGEVTGDVSRCR